MKSKRNIFKKQNIEQIVHHEADNNTLSQAFIWLFIGLLVCFGVSYVSTLNVDVAYKAFTFLGSYTCLIFLVLEIIIALVLVVRITKLSSSMAKILYLLYTALTGFSLTGLAYVYTASSIAMVFLITALLFGVFAFIGKNTKIDLSRWWVYLFFGLLAVVILEIINIFLMNNTLNIVLCAISVLIFCGYTAYDVQKAVDKAFLANCENKGIYIAFQLFLDFVNLFLDLLELFGKDNN